MLNSNRKFTITFRTTKEVIDNAKDQSLKDSRSISALCHVALVEYLERAKFKDKLEKIQKNIER